MSEGYDFGLNPFPRASLQQIGLEGERLLILDGVMTSPSSLVDYAAEEVVFTTAGNESGGYPGVRAPAPLNYVNSLVRAMSPIIERAFELEGVALARAECNFSMVTTRAEDLRPLQRVPHFDTTDPLQFAFVHYLCGEEFGGTAFYRQLCTGYEVITPERLTRHSTERAREALAASGYITGNTPHYHQTGIVPARFNRVAIYRSRMLHSGIIGGSVPLIADARAGRLTANIFVNYRRRS